MSNWATMQSIYESQKDSEYDREKKMKQMRFQKKEEKKKKNNKNKICRTAILLIKTETFIWSEWPRNQKCLDKPCDLSFMQFPMLTPRRG